MAKYTFMIYIAYIFQNNTVRVTEISQFLNNTKMIQLIFFTVWCYNHDATTIQVSVNCQVAYLSVLVSPS